MTRPALAWPLIAVAYATMLLFGLVENIKGVSFPLLKQEYGAAYAEQGGLVSGTWAGYVLFCLVASLCLGRLGLKRSLVAGYLLVCAGSLATMLAPDFWSATLALLAVNAGFGFFEIGVNALGAVIFVRRAALMMNLLHCCYGLGAIAGPLLAGHLTEDWAWTWRGVYLAALVPVVGVLGMVLATTFPARPAAPSGAIPIPAGFLAALRDPLVLLLCATLGAMEVMEFGAANWGGLYLQDVHGLDPRREGATFVAAFYVLFTLSRLVLAPVVERLGDLRSLRWATGTGLGLLLGGFVGSELWVRGVEAGRHGLWLLPASGIPLAVMFPTVMAVAMRRFGSDAERMLGPIITVSGALNGVAQLGIGFTCQWFGHAWGYRSCVLYALLALVLLRLVRRRLEEPAGAPSAANAATPGG